MAVKITDIKNEAQALHERHESETGRRTAASKHYYYAFHLCKSIWPSLSKPGNYGMHKAFCNGLKESEQLRKIGGNLDKLRSLRVDADYYIQKDFYKMQLDRAKELVDSIEKEIIRILHP
ncbi:MAG: hypothetical protein HQL97_00805 [Magnetococcales bacterium]|nr:hypothetical protein [Magnetococcales bacterium]